MHEGKAVIVLCQSCQMLLAFMMLPWLENKRRGISLIVIVVKWAATLFSKLKTSVCLQALLFWPLYEHGARRKENYLSKPLPHLWCSRFQFHLGLYFTRAFKNLLDEWKACYTQLECLWSPVSLSYFFVKKYLLVGASGMLWAGGSVSGSVVQWISGSVDQWEMYVCHTNQIRSTIRNQSNFLL